MQPRPASCPRNVAVFLPLANSHSRRVWSRLPEARVLPSGLYATEVTWAVWPLRVSVTFGSGADRDVTAPNPRNTTPRPITTSGRDVIVGSMLSLHQEGALRRGGRAGIQVDRP